MKKDLNYYLNLPYTIKIKKLDDGDYLAQYVDLGLTKNNLMAGWGANEAEAIEDLKAAFACYVEGALKDGDIIPEPVSEDKVRRINITMPEAVIKAIDNISGNRSAWLTETARRALAM